MNFDPFVDAINERLRLLIDDGAGRVVYYTRTKADECEWRRDRYAVRMARYARAGAVVNRFTGDRGAGPSQAVEMDADGIADVAAIVLEHAANPDAERTYAPYRS
ncbi:MAG TPA: hypothetical protein VMA36_17625 [Candidatus Limnocylindria bacterium]|nr:hypothetical protein [Candidatus Limnocylindria bacterium]